MQNLSFGPCLQLSIYLQPVRKTPRILLSAIKHNNSILQGQFDYQNIFILCVSQRNEEAKEVAFITAISQKYQRLP